MTSTPDSDILRYIIEHQVDPGERLPTINELSSELGVSVSKLREDLAVIRTLGLVKIRPRTGTQVQAFNFGPVLTTSVLYALALNRDYFQDFSKLRRSVELSFWREAVALLGPAEIAYLRELLGRARDKLNRVPVIVPFEEHRCLHLTFFKHLQNPFVQGVLEAYWAAYQAYGLALYADLSYHREVWTYHERMVELVAQGDFDGSYQALKDHMELLRYVPEQGNANGNKEAASPIYHFFE